MTRIRTTGIVPVRQLTHDPEAADLGAQIAREWAYDGLPTVLTGEKLRAACRHTRRAHYRRFELGEEGTAANLAVLSRLQGYLAAAVGAPNIDATTPTLPPGRVNNRRELIQLHARVFCGRYPHDVELSAVWNQQPLELPFADGVQAVVSQGNNTMAKFETPDPDTGKVSWYASHGPLGLRYALDFIVAGAPAGGLGEPVVAARSGLVFAYGGAREGKPDNHGFGNTVFVLHDNGFASCYAHLEELQVRTGQRVRGGEAIGTLGNTGLAGLPHLHFHVVKPDRPAALSAPMSEFLRPTQPFAMNASTDDGSPAPLLSTDFFSTDNGYFEPVTYSR